MVANEIRTDAGQEVAGRKNRARAPGNIIWQLIWKESISWRRAQSSSLVSSEADGRPLGEIRFGQVNSQTIIMISHYSSFEKTQCNQMKRKARPALPELSYFARRRRRPPK